MRRVGIALLAVVALVGVLAPWLAPNPPDRGFSELLNAPPTRVRIWDGGPRAPFIYRQRVLSRLERRFETVTTERVALRWFRQGRLVTADPDADAPLLLLGADAYGRDVFARLVHGSRPTLALALIATLGATLLGGLIGGVSGYAGGRVDLLLSRLTEFVLVLPAIYVVLALRATLPLVVPPRTVFLSLAAIFVLLGWPTVARGVRAIIASERSRDYVSAAEALGAGSMRVLLRHLLPSARGHLTMQATLLLPAFILAEATMSYIGLGFPEATPTWGTMLQAASNTALLADTPWALAPAGAIFLVVLAVNLTVQDRARKYN
ncbi:MAG TPA: ABC transporter permease [Gemmatimonadales bacterium]|nr:ABC transporter permease [Gemmatimonadales bacterium]